MILRALTALAAPAGPNSRLSVFYFHRVLAQPDPLLPSEPDARMFERILGWISAQFRVLDPIEACDRLFAGTLPSRPAVITFDDGYRDNYTVALPILQRHRARAAFFVATGFLEGGMMFNDRVIEAVRHAAAASVRLPGASDELPLDSVAARRAAIDRILSAIKHLPAEQRMQRVHEVEAVLEHASKTGAMMRPDDVAALHRAGMRIGGHTRTHPILLKLPDAEAEREIRAGLDDLASITGELPQLFAYPNGKPGGDYESRHVAMVECAGCRYAFTTASGAAVRETSRLEIPRFTPWDRTHLKFAARAFRNVSGS